MQINHILVTTDLSEEALRPCASIAEIARNRGARITLLHVVEDATSAPRGAALAPPVTSADLDDRMADAREKLKAHGAAFGDDVPVTLEVISGDNMADAIANYASRNGVDMIAISTHGRTGFRRLILGSVAEELLRKSSVPVLAFPRYHE